jgi:hypothetical protein
MSKCSTSNTKDGKMVTRWPGGSFFYRGPEMGGRDKEILNSSVIGSSSLGLNVVLGNQQTSGSGRGQTAEKEEELMHKRESDRDRASPQCSLVPKTIGCSY